jgi:hypothetical protein
MHQNRPSHATRHTGIARRSSRITCSAPRVRASQPPLTWRRLCACQLGAYAVQHATASRRGAHRAQPQPAHEPNIQRH